MFFVHHIPVYAAALLSAAAPPALPLSVWATAAAAALAAASCTEEWPISNMALFPFSAKQARALRRAFGGSLRLIGTADRADPTGRTLADAGALDLAAWALRASVPLAPGQWEGDGRFGVPTYLAAPWLDLRGMDLARRPLEAAAAARRSVGGRRIVDAARGEALEAFHVVELAEEDPPAAAAAGGGGRASSEGRGLRVIARVLASCFD